MNLYELTQDEVLELRLQATHFNIHYNDYKKYRHIVDNLVSEVSDGKSRKEVMCIVTNLARALSYRASALMIPREYKAYTGNRQKIRYNKVNSVVDKMTEQGYFVCYKGGFMNDMSVKMVSTYLFTDKINSMFMGVDIKKESEYHPLVVIKDRDTSQFKPTRGCSEMVSKIQCYNNVLHDAIVTFNGKVLPHQTYFRSFVDNQTTCGRFYNTAGGVQTMPQKQRSKLKINGEDVVELDFKAMHPSILYEWKWQDEPERVEKWIDFMFNGAYDPYKADTGLLLEVDEDIVQEYKRKHGLAKYDPLRNLIKYCVMVGLNAQSHMDACRALTSEFYGEAKKWDKEDTGDFKYYGIIKPANFNSVCTFPASFFCMACMNANQPIKEHFFTDKGVELQYIDSEIMFRVLNSLTEMGEPAFSEHDSIIVRKSLTGKAKKLMEDAYLSVVGSTNFCIIAEK
jgi:hypothetical protein